jgi:hypothetical protein
MAAAVSAASCCCCIVADIELDNVTDVIDIYSRPAEAVQRVQGDALS